MATAALTNKSSITIIPCSPSPDSPRYLSLHLRSQPLPTSLPLIATTARPPRLSHPLRRHRHRLARAAAAEASASSGDRDVGIVELIRAFLPGGSWWKLDGGGGGADAKAGAEGGKAVTVKNALRRMWALVAQDRWIIVVAFVSLIVAALSDISIPHFLAASIFSAQSGEKATFYRLGDLTSRLGADCQQVSRVISNDLNMISRYGLQGTGALIYLFILSWPLALSTLLICTVLSTILFFYGQYQKGAAKLIQELSADANEVAQETLSLMRTVRVYGTENHEFGRYTKWLEKLSDINLRQSLAYGFWNLSFNFLYHSTQATAVLIGGISIMSGHISAEQLTKFILYSEWLIYATWSLGDNWSALMQSIGASEKVFQLMDRLPGNEFLSRGLKLQKLEGRIDFVNLFFRYPTRMTVQALQHVNFSVYPHEVVALVGLSGSGKSTLVNLLLRLYEPTNGQILVDGIPLGDLDIKWFREKIGYVGQEPRLFRMDVSSNIRYGCPRMVSHEEVEWAAKQAFAHEFILSLPNGYNTLVDNTLLSGGQKQRIAIARALIRDPTILILDEATSALDAESEHYVKGVLRAVQDDSKKKRTVIVIAHRQHFSTFALLCIILSCDSDLSPDSCRLSTIQAADRIVVMDSGRIAEIGSHLELIQKDGLYARLAKRQADAFA